MEQMTLWIPEQAANLATNPIWEELNPGVKKDTVIKLSLLIVRFSHLLCGEKPIGNRFN